MSQPTSPLNSMTLRLFYHRTMQNSKYHDGNKARGLHAPFMSEKYERLANVEFFSAVVSQSEFAGQFPAVPAQRQRMDSRLETVFCPRCKVKQMRGGVVQVRVQVLKRKLKEKNKYASKEGNKINGEQIKLVYLAAWTWSLGRG